MSKVAVMMAAEHADGMMSGHFGKAEWLMIADTESASREFVKNEALNGRGAAEIVISAGCGNVIVTDIGDGALNRLQAAGVCVWAVSGPLAGAEALRKFSAGELPGVPSVLASAKQAAGHGCCCSNHEHGASGHASSDTGSSCCRG